MEVTGDELAGVVDLFGGLTRDELGSGLAELAFKRGEEDDPTAFAGAIDQAIATYHLVRLDPDDVTAGVDAPLLVVGPAAFPELPEGATDLVHILDVEERPVDREVAARQAVERFRADAASAVDTGDEQRIGTLIDVSYELEAWGSVDLGDVRARLEQPQG